MSKMHQDSLLITRKNRSSRQLRNPRLMHRGVSGDSKLKRVQALINTSGMRGYVMSSQAASNMNLIQLFICREQLQKAKE